MISQFRNIGLIGRVDSDLVIHSLQRLAQLLEQKSVTVILEEETSLALGEHSLQVANRKIMGEICDLVIVVGGDGSLLGAARDLARSGVPILGINRGRLGFLTDILPEDIEQQVSAVLEGKYQIESRFLLETQVKRDGAPIAQSAALNDIVLHSGQAPKMLHFELYVEGKFVYAQHSDGLIISTPTGSTAYSLSGGGPIMHPALNAIVLVPMFPHTLSSRPIVIDANHEVKIVVAENNIVSPRVSCDGQVNIAVRALDVIYIRKKRHQLQLLHPEGHDFYQTCRDKLGWGNHPIN